MIGEREDIINDTSYGKLTMRSYDIDNNIINAFYDDDDDIVFVLDKTITEKKPNVLLVINPDGDKKWDEILSGQYGVDLETIRPKQDNKYQKLDIEYSGLNVYENLIRAHDAGDDISDGLVQLNILRDSAARHSAMVRLNVANETIVKTNATIVKTKETIIRLQERLKTLRAKLSSSRKEIGKVSTKQSAAKILRLESQIEATNEKLKRAKKRLESAQRRLEAATVDAELSSDLLNQPETEIVVAPKKVVAVKKEMPVAKVEVEEEPVFDGPVESDDDDDDYIDDDEVTSDIKPLFDTEPELDENIAFKPIDFSTPVMQSPVFEKKEVEFDAPSYQETSSEAEETVFEAPVLDEIKPLSEPEPAPTPVPEQKPVLETFQPITDIENITEMDDTPMANEEKPVLETMTPSYNDAPIPDIQLKPVADEEQEPVDVRPVEEIIQPVSPIPPVENHSAEPLPEYKPVMEKEHSKPTFIYYVLLAVLIGLSVVTLWLYQKNMSGNTTGPVLVADTTEEVVVEKEPEVAPAVAVEEVKVQEEPEISEDEIFLDDKPVEEPAPVVEEPVIEPSAEENVSEVVAEEPVVEPEAVVEPEPVIKEPVEESAPVIADDVSANVMSLPTEEMDEEPIAEPMTEEEILASKPVFETGSKHDDMFVQEEDGIAEQPVADETVTEETEIIAPADQEGIFFDEEENAYQQELEYEE